MITTKLSEAAETFGIAKPTAKVAINVCRKLERDIRISLLPFAHHQLVAGREDVGYLPRGKLSEACELFGIAKDVARDAKFVSGKIESAGRTAQLSFGHHKAVAGRHDAGELLA